MCADIDANCLDDDSCVGGKVTDRDSRKVTSSHPFPVSAAFTSGSTVKGDKGVETCRKAWRGEQIDERGESDIGEESEDRVAGEEIEVTVDVDVVDDDLECPPRRRSSKVATLPGRGAVRGSSPCPTA
jgi:hypothetical protein